MQGAKLSLVGEDNYLWSAVISHLWTAPTVSCWVTVEIGGIAFIGIAMLTRVIRTATVIASHHQVCGQAIEFKHFFSCYRVTTKTPHTSPNQYTKLTKFKAFPEPVGNLSANE